jgi:hypothetical protein
VLSKITGWARPIITVGYSTISYCFNVLSYTTTILNFPSVLKIKVNRVTLFKSSTLTVIGSMLLNYGYLLPTNFIAFLRISSVLITEVIVLELIT